MLLVSALGTLLLTFAADATDASSPTTTLFVGTTRSRLPGILRAGLLMTGRGGLWTTPEAAFPDGRALAVTDLRLARGTVPDPRTWIDPATEAEIVVVRVRVPTTAHGTLRASRTTDGFYTYDGLLSPRWMAVPDGTDIPDAFRVLPSRATWARSLEGRYPGIVARLTGPETLQAVANDYGLSKERIRQFKYQQACWLKRERGDIP